MKPFGTEARAPLVAPAVPGGQDAQAWRAALLERLVALEEPLTHEKTDLMKKCVDVARRAAQEEQKYFLTTEQNANLDPDTVVKVQYLIDPDKHIRLLCQTLKSRYGIILVLNNTDDLTWKETRAASAAVEIVRRGALLSDAGFRQHADAMRAAFGQAYVQLSKRRLYMIVQPDHDKGSGGKLRTDTILSTSVVLRERTVLVRAATAARRFTFRLYTLLAQQELCVMHCRALQDILAVLEPGERMSKVEFYFHAHALRKHYNYGLVTVAGENDVEYLLVPTPTSHDAPIEHTLKLAHESCQPRTVREDAVQFPGYTIEGTIKPSGQSTVYKGVRDETKERVAIKVFNKRSTLGEYKVELRVLLKMSDHPNVVDVIDFFESPRPALIMPLIEGEDLLDYLKRRGALDEATVRKIGLDVAKGVQHLHKNGIVHRDIKSPNILIDKSSGRAVIIDFGYGQLDTRSGASSSLGSSFDVDIAAALNSASLVKTDKRKGTQLWMSPEMFQRNQWSPKTDVFALGIVIWELLSGRVPYVDESELWSGKGIMQYVCAGGRPGLHHIAGAPEDLKRLVQQCWESKPDKRPSMRQVVDVLRGNNPHELFAEADGDCNGEIDFPEFVNFLQKYRPGEVPNEAMADLFRALDGDKNGSVNLSEFLTFWEQVDRVGLSETLTGLRKLAESEKPVTSSVAAEGNSINPNTRRVFEQVDRDKSGALNFSEFSRFLKSYSPFPIPLHQMKPIYDRIDADGSGSVTLDEFDTFWNQVETVGLANAIKSVSADVDSKLGL